MSQENEIEAKKLSPTTDFLPSDGASCSPSFEVPPTPHPSGAWDRSDFIHHARKLEAALREISKQHLAVEMDDHTCEHANWQAGYEQCVKAARAALGLSENAERIRAEIKP